MRKRPIVEGSGGRGNIGTARRCRQASENECESGPGSGQGDRERILGYQGERCPGARRLIPPLGDLIGAVTDYAGHAIERIVSLVDGYLMDGLTAPPVKAGEAVVTLGIPAPAPK